MFLHKNYTKLSPFCFLISVTCFLNWHCTCRYVFFLYHFMAIATNYSIQCVTRTIATTRSIIDQYRDGPPVTILQEHIMKLNDSLRKAQSILIYIGTALWWKYYMRTQWRLTTRFAEALAAVLHDGVRFCLWVFLSFLNVVVTEKSDSSYHLVCRRCKPWLILFMPW